MGQARAGDSTPTHESFAHKIELPVGCVHYSGRSESWICDLRYYLELSKVGFILKRKSHNNGELSSDIAFTFHLFRISSALLPQLFVASI